MRTSTNPIEVVKGGVTTVLDTLAFNIETKTGLAGMAPLRGGDNVIPGKHGRLYTPGRKREEGRIYLSMWVTNTDADGILAATAVAQHAQYRANVDALMMLFDTDVTTITLREQISATETREAVCECEIGLRPDRDNPAYARMTVELIIIDTFWASTADAEWISTVGTGAANSGNPITLTPFDGATAPMESLLISIDGTWTNPSITDVGSGHRLQWTGTLGSGRQLFFNTDTWEALEGPNTMNYTGAGGTTVTAAVAAFGARAPKLFGLTPLPGGPKIQLTGSVLGAASRVRIKGRKRFH